MIYFTEATAYRDDLPVFVNQTAMRYFGLSK
jgi:hypothetical protein